MIQITRKHYHKNSHLIVIHSLNQKLFVKREKEKRSTFTCWLLRFEYLLPVEFCMETLLNLLICNVVHSPDSFENGWCILNSLDFFVNPSYFILISSEVSLALKHIKFTGWICLVSFHNKVSIFCAIPFINIFDYYLLDCELSLSALLQQYLLCQFLLARSKVDWGYTCRF